jgi:hypothetical protein
MTAEDVDLNLLRQRLELLEKRTRFWKRSVLICALLASTAGIMAANEEAPTPNVVAAHAFELKDQSGKVRAAMFLNDVNQPALCLYDDRGKERLNLRIVDGPELWMFDETGKSRVSIRGTNQEPELVMFHKGTNLVMARVTATENGGAIGTWTAQNQASFTANWTGTSVRQGFQLLDHNAKVRAQIAKGPNTNPYFKLFDENGNGRIMMFIGELGENACGLTFFDTNGQQSLLNLGALNGQTGFIQGSTPTNQAAFDINYKGIGAKKFESRR